MIEGFEAPVRRSLIEPILLGGAPRSIAIVNGTLAVTIAVGLQLLLPGLVIGVVGHCLSVWAAKLDAQFVEVFSRHLKYRSFLDA